MIFKPEYFDMVNVSMSALRFGLANKELQDFIHDELNVEVKYVSVAIRGCTRCITDLLNKIGKQNFLKLNMKLKDLDSRGLLVRPTPETLRRQQTFKTVKDAKKFLDTLQVVNQITIFFK